MNKKNNYYDNIIVGAGIAGCSLSYFLKKYSDSILLIDRNMDVAYGASGAAGAFLSPLLGKPNSFKDLVTKALNFSTDFYKNNFSQNIINCGTSRIPKDKKDRDKFNEYIPYMDFDYEKLDDGYFFKIGSIVNPYDMCKSLVKNIETKFSYNINKIEKKDDLWIINDEISCKNIFLTTGADISLINEIYFNIRAVWGQKIDVLTTTKTFINYHKECSLSISKEFNDKNLLSIGATHHRFNCDSNICNECVKTANINQQISHSYSQETVDKDTKNLLSLANDIKKLDNVEVYDIKIGARASSVDYFPMVGKLVDSNKSFEKFPHLKNGTHIKDDNLDMIDNLYVINGVGGRGFVLSPYLANNLVESIYNNKEIDNEITTYRLFKRWAKKLK